MDILLILEIIKKRMISTNVSIYNPGCFINSSGVSRGSKSKRLKTIINIDNNKVICMQDVFFERLSIKS
ncbi:hypothetical protein PPNK14_21720 [Pectobacterium parmentieri]